MLWKKLCFLISFHAICEMHMPTMDKARKAAGNTCHLSYGCTSSVSLRRYHTTPHNKCLSVNISYIIHGSNAYRYYLKWIKKNSTYSIVVKFGLHYEEVNKVLKRELREIYGVFNIFHYIPKSLEIYCSGS